VADGRTDGWTRDDSKYRVSTASRGKKTSFEVALTTLKHFSTVTLKIVTYELDVQN